MHAVVTSMMQTALRRPEQMIETAVRAARETPGEALSAVLEELPAAVYVTDAEGVVTHFNRACVALAGRTPVAGEDRWCVTWRIHTTDGEFLPHDQCPMAVAVRERRPVRGVQAVAERPDGGRIAFQPHPTPVFDEAGEFVGAVNLLLDVTDRNRARDLRAQAAKCRRLAAGVDDRAAAAALLGLAEECEARAAELGRAH